eukprot:CAMPEP_0172519416 /NCGR_PEP_ID=MMETSP1066-20121228/291403_1 /TAXON_ID=671091 /ORGANISM="Coscinodiscus wailesii, Strain CCMP2513" /LENGTH=271 /DNA_ID=CAMNT_0013301999 /DNA_START=78 /DNA_END=893 /DNA_ORIENTATION=+
MTKQAILAAFIKISSHASGESWYLRSTKDKKEFQHLKLDKSISRVLAEEDCNPSYKCHQVHFQTASDNESQSQSSFTVAGYGRIPKYCHDAIGAECDIEVCGVETLAMNALGADAWKFYMTGDIGDMIDHETVAGGTHMPPFPTMLDTDQFDSYQEYSFKDANGCYQIQFTTASEENSESQGEFSIDGYGFIPKSCHNKRGAKCTIQVCDADSLKIRALDDDGWRFTITGDVGTLIDFLTVPTGEHTAGFPTWMDTDQFDYYQRYEFVLHN